MRTTAIMNLKGGVAKTITAVNMAMMLAEKHGKRVLLIDADHQGNSSLYFDIEDGAPTMFDVLTANNEPYWADNISPSGIEGLDILPADMTLARLDMPGEDDLGERNRRKFRLREFIIAAAEDDAYDHVFIDMPPSFSTAAQAALIAADDVIIPMKIDAFSLVGMRELLMQISNMRTINAALHLAGVLVTMHRRSESTSEAIELLRKSRVPVFSQTIRWTDQIVDESTHACEPLHRYSPRCAAARDYAKFLNEYLGGTTNAEK